MATAFSKDEQTTNSRDVAVLAVYLGLPLLRVETHGYGTDERVTYTVRCKEFDFEILCKEADSADTPVCFEPLMRANSFVGGKVRYARKNGGTWTNSTKPITPQKRPA
jgi:hypothetical protein